jgi:hypothetical protein
MTQKLRAKNGPFRGYRSSVPKHLIDPAEAGPGSRDFLISQQEGKWIERAGSVILGDTISGSDSATGLLPTKYSSRARQIMEMPNVKDYEGLDQFADGYPSYGCLFTVESAEAAGSPVTPQSGKGQDYFRTTNGTDSNQVPAMSFSADTYPTTARSGDKSWLKIIPFWHNVQGPHRCSTAADRTLMCAGSRRALIVGNWKYYPNLYASPMRWNLNYNDNSAAPNRIERHAPIGLIPPLFPASFETSELPTPTAAVAQWKENERFYISMCYIFEDGSWSMPYTPRPRTDAADSGFFCNHFGLVTIPVGANPYYAYVPWDGIPNPPPGCTHLALLRSPKVDSATGHMPKINDLRITAIIAAGTNTYNDYGGDDGGLIVDDERVHFKHIWPPRARYIGAFDGRLGIGYTRHNPAMIVLAPTGSTEPNDITASDHENMTAIAYTVRILGSGTDTIVLSKIDGGGGFPAAPASVSLSLVSKTVQALVDEINETVLTTSACDEWRAQLAPGADGNAPASDLIGTVQTLTYGDDGLASGGTTRHQVAISQAYPAVIYMDRSAMQSRYPQPDKIGFWHTRANPTSLGAGIAAAANYWHADNRRVPPVDSGIYMGLAALTDGTVLFYSKKVWLFRNTFAGRSGKDEDYRFDLVSNDGCIAWDSIVEFNNAVGWLSIKGFKVAGPASGGFQESLIAGAIYDMENNLGKSDYRIHGNLTYEIEQCVAATGADNDAAEFRARVIGSALYIHYRSSSSVTKPDVMHVYDYSEGVGSGGIAELFRPDGTPYGWSAPLRLPGSCLGFYNNATGLVKLHTIDTNAGSTGDGRIDQFETGYQDNTTAIGTLLYTKMDDMNEPQRRHRTHKFTTKYKSPTGHVLAVSHSRDRARSSATSYTLLNTGSAELGVQTKRVKLAGLSPGRVTEFKFSGTRVTAGAAEIWLIDREVKLLDTPVDAAG